MYIKQVSCLFQQKQYTNISKKMGKKYQQMFHRDSDESANKAYDLAKQFAQEKLQESIVAQDLIDDDEIPTIQNRDR